MTDDSRSLAIEGLRFCGEMSASLTHEIKNVLAIVNENAGLLQDMIQMAEKGIPLAPERLLRLGQSISRQVKRGDEIVKGMNRFAHSADHPTETVDVGELIHFIIQLGDRLITLKGEPPEVEVESATPLTADTNRFFLENLVWVCLRRAMDLKDANKRLSIIADRIEQSVRIRFCGLAVNAASDPTGFPSERETMVARLLGAQLSMQKKEGQISLNLP